MPSSTLIAQVIGISTALIGAGGIATMSAFSVPMLQSQPADRALPQIRWLFSRGSHTAPQAGILSCTSFLYLAFEALPSGEINQMLSHAVQGGAVSGYLAAAILAIAIAPVTAKLMIPDPNFTLIKMNAQLGGTRSRKVAEEEGTKPDPNATADDSVHAKAPAEELSDLSLPQGKTGRSSTKEEDEEVRRLLGKFGTLNYVRAGLIGAGGIVGLITALAG